MAEFLSTKSEKAQTDQIGVRSRLTRRLIDIVCLPETSLSPQERWITADILEELLGSTDAGLKAKIASRLAKHAKSPGNLLCKLAVEPCEIAEPILRTSKALSNCDIIEIIPKIGREHLLALADRNELEQSAVAALCQTGDLDVILAVLSNKGAEISQQTISFLVQKSQKKEQIGQKLVTRNELRPRQAFALFWDVDHDSRRIILERFAASRAIMQDVATDLFALVAKGENQDRDPVLQSALEYIERRQRDRQAAHQSQYGSLEALIDAANQSGLSGEMRAQAAAMANIHRDLFDRIIDDAGGEPAAIFCKATGLKRVSFECLIYCGRGVDNAQRRQLGGLVYDTISVDKAQTALRYWSWVFTSLTRL